MEVVAVSQSQPQWVDINGVRTRTSIIHTLSSSIVLETDADIKGNKTAVHDAPVYAFLAHHYDYWREKLGISKESWNWCHWGENITFKSDEYMTEFDFNLGDLWKVGDEVVLQVCGARVPCFKLSWRCGQKDRWLKELANTGFCGVYFRIVKGGIIQPGDRAQLLEKHRSSPNVGQITQLAFDNRLETKDTLNLLVREPGLLRMNKDTFIRKLVSIHDEEVLGQNHWNGWRTFRAVRIVQECKEVKSFYLEPSDKKPLGTYRPGQFLTVRLPNGLLRNWSISDWPDHDNPSYYRLSIKRAGVASAWMHNKCNNETKLFVRPPAGCFNLDWSPAFPMRQVYLSAGIGITPMVAMLKAHLKHYTMRRAPAVWIYVAQNEDQFPKQLASEVLDLYDEALQQDKILEAFVFYTRSRPIAAPGKCEEVVRGPLVPFEPAMALLHSPADTDTDDTSGPDSLATSSPSEALPFQETPAGRGTSRTDEFWSSSRSPNSGRVSIHEDGVVSRVQTRDNEAIRYIHNRRPDCSFITDLISPSYFINPLKITPIELPGPQTTTFYICGSDSFEQDMKSHLRTLGVPEMLMKSESFLPGKTSESEATGIRKARVGFAKANLTVDWIVPEQEHTTAGQKSMTLLELAESSGLEPNYGCRAGQCGACKVPLLKGSVDGGLQPDGGVLICQARPASDCIELEL